MRNFLVQSIEIQKRVGSFSMALDTINKCLSEAICSLFRGRLDGESRTAGLIHSGNEILETYTYYPDVRWNYYLLFPCSHISLLGLWDSDILKLCMIFHKWTFSSLELILWWFDTDYALVLIFIFSLIFFSWNDLWDQTLLVCNLEVHFCHILTSRGYWW